MVNLTVKNDILELTTRKQFAVKDNAFKQILRNILHTFGNLYYLDGNGNRTNVKCIFAEQERIYGKLKQDNTLILPLISVNEVMVANSETRNKYSTILVQEKIWDKEKNRAVRVLSLAPRAVDLVYQVNIWAKFKDDMDQLRTSILSMFNPALNIRTSYSDYNKAFIEQEEDVGNLRAADSDDRTLQKSITFVVQTYIPNPKFMYTNTGEITEYNYDIQVFKPQDSFENDDPIATESHADNLSLISDS